MNEEIIKLEEEIQNLKKDYEILVNENCSVKEKSVVLKKMILLYEKMQEVAYQEKIELEDRIKTEEDKYFDFYQAYQTGKVQTEDFYQLMKRLLNLSKIKYDSFVFRFNSGYQDRQLKNIESSFFILIEKEKLLNLKMMEYYGNFNVHEFKRYLFEYFKDGGEGFVFSDTHCLDFEFNFNVLNTRRIETIDGNPIYSIQDINNSFLGYCIGEVLCYIKEKGFDYMVSPVSKIKRKLYSDFYE